MDIKNQRFLVSGFLIIYHFLLFVNAETSCQWTDVTPITVEGFDANFDMNEVTMYFNCTESLLTAVTFSNDGTQGSANEPYCDWMGAWSIFDDNWEDTVCGYWMFECYDNVLYSIKKTGSAAYCSFEYSGMGLKSNGALCNFAAPVLLNGGSNTGLSIGCDGGNLASLTVTTDALSLSENFKQHQHVPNKNRTTSEAPTCTSWSTPTGEWQLVYEHNQDFSVDMTYGTSSTDSDATTTEWSESLEASMETGILFEKETVTATVSTSMSQTIESSTTVSYSETITIPCSSSDGKNNGGSLYQWVVSAQHPGDTDSTTQVFSDSSKCISYQSVPQCPLEACSDEDCQKCDDWQSASNSTETYVLAGCNWDGDLSMVAWAGGVFTFSCTNDQMVYTTSSLSTEIGDSAGCLACNWDGPMVYSEDGGTRFMNIECYDGFLYSITDEAELLVNQDGPVSPAETLTGTSCNWDGVTQLGTFDGDDERGPYLQITCTDGKVALYFEVQ